MSTTEDLTWKIDTERPDGGIIANGVESDMPEYQRGQDVDLTFLFWGDGDGIGSRGGTFGTQYGMTFGGDYGGTFGEAANADHLDRYKAARQYVDYAGSGTVNVSLNGVPSVIERLPSDAPVSSIVIPVEPGDGYTATKGFWGFVKSGDDPTTYADDVTRLTLTFTVLAELDEYATRAELKADLGGGILS